MRHRGGCHRPPRLVVIAASARIIVKTCLDVAPIARSSPVLIAFLHYRRKEQSDKYQQSRQQNERENDDTDEQVRRPSSMRIKMLLPSTTFNAGFWAIANFTCSALAPEES